MIQGTKIFKHEQGKVVMQMCLPIQMQLLY